MVYILPNFRLIWVGGMTGKVPMLDIELNGTW